jgi:hypothetical protein
MKLARLASISTSSHRDADLTRLADAPAARRTSGGPRGRGLRAAVAGALASMTLFSAASASAVEVTNHDDRPWLIKVVHTAPGATPRELAVPSRASAPWLCSGPCRIEVAGVGTLETDGSVNIAIRDGRFAVEKPNAQTGLRVASR